MWDGKLGKLLSIIESPSWLGGWSSRDLLGHEGLGQLRLIANNQFWSGHGMFSVC